MGLGKCFGLEVGEEVCEDRRGRRVGEEDRSSKRVEGLREGL